MPEKAKYYCLFIPHLNRLTALRLKRVPVCYRQAFLNERVCGAKYENFTTHSSNFGALISIINIVINNCNNKNRKYWGGSQGTV